MGTIFWYQGVPHRAPDVGLSKHRDDADRLRLCLWARPEDTCMRDPTAGHVWGPAINIRTLVLQCFIFISGFPDVPLPRDLRSPSVLSSALIRSFVASTEELSTILLESLLSHLCSFISSKNVHRSTLWPIFFLFVLLSDRLLHLAR